MTPWQLAIGGHGKSSEEHANQKAIFAWANCAAAYGFFVASTPAGYSLADREALIQSTPAEGLVGLGADAGRLVPRSAPELTLLFAIHNQGHGDAIRGGMARAEGVKPGVPDMFLPVPRNAFAGLFIELKKLSKKPKTANAAGGLSDEQREWFTGLRSQHYRVEVAYGWLEAVAVLCDYLGQSRHAPK